MSLLIKGLNMPKDGELLCINVYPNGKVCIDMDLKCKQIATAVSVPPHGRLIDKDALEYDISHGVVFSGKLYNPEIIGANKIINRIHHAPTIIEAEVDDG